MANLSYGLKERFIKEAIPSDLLNDIVDWIADNLVPEDVFSEELLEDWAKDNRFVKEEE
jgi:hypothetical protein